MLSLEACAGAFEREGVEARDVVRFWANDYGRPGHPLQEAGPMVRTSGEVVFHLFPIACQSTSYSTSQAEHGGAYQNEGTGFWNSGIRRRRRRRRQDLGIVGR